MGNSTGSCDMGGSGFVPGDDTDPAHYAHHPNILKLTKKDFHVPLTEREILTLTRSWKTIRRHMVSTGVIMFLGMFERSDEVREMFEQFRSSDTVTELQSSHALQAHALLVMNTLDESFTNFDDKDYLVDNLLATGLTHRRFEEFTAPVFWAIEKPFLKAVRNTLGTDRYTPTLDRLYRKAIRFILSVLIVGFTQALHKGRRGGSGSNDNQAVHKGRQGSSATQAL